MPTHDDPADALAATRVRFGRAAARFSAASADVWSEWADDRVARIITEQYAITSRTTDEVLGALKRLTAMAVVGRAVQISTERLEAVDPAHWEAVEHFDARSARAEVDALRSDLPAELVEALAAAGYDVDAPDPTGRARTAHRIAYERAVGELISTAGALANAAAQERATERGRHRAAALRRWTTA